MLEQKLYAAKSSEKVASIPSDLVSSLFSFEIFNLVIAFSLTFKEWDDLVMDLVCFGDMYVHFYVIPT